MANSLRAVRAACSDELLRITAGEFAMADVDSPFSFMMIDIVYDEPTRELLITHRDGQSFIYCAVPPSVYRDLMRAPARGGFFFDHIRNAYPCVRSESRRRA
jgi:hypothetical protein